MTVRKPVLFILVILVFVAGAYFFKKKYYNPWHKKVAISRFVYADANKEKFANGDIIFQTSQSAQSKAIQLATHSTYSHCGIIHWEAGDCFVWEAHNGVEGTSIEDFIARGKGGHFVIKRLKPEYDKKLDYPTVVNKMDSIYYTYRNKPYDIYFGWSDDKIYCSELVWKLYKQATGYEVGTLQKLSDFDLSNPVVKSKMKERYGNNIPMNETVVSPSAIFNSPLLYTVYEQ